LLNKSGVVFEITVIILEVSFLWGKIKI